MSKRISILGASGHGKIVLSTARQAGYDVIAMYDDNQELFNVNMHDVLVKGGINDCLSNTNLITAIGDNYIRYKVVNRIRHAKWTSLIHPKSYVDPSVSFDIGTIFCAGSTVQIDTVIGVHSILNTNSSIDHDCEIGDFVHIAPGVNICGGVKVGDGSMIGVGASVIPNISIGKNCIVGAGSVVVADIPDGSVVMGCPAKIIKYKANDYV